MTIQTKKNTCFLQQNCVATKNHRNFKKFITFQYYEHWKSIIYESLIKMYNEHTYDDCYNWSTWFWCQSQNHENFESVEDKI